MPEKIRPRCFQPWQTLMIDASGLVQPCAYRGNYNNTRNVEPFGSLKDENLDAIWNSPVAQRVRACMAAGDLEGAGCGNCLALKQGHSLGLDVAPEVVDGTPYADNMALKEAEIAAGATILESKPTVLYYTPSHHCNLRCLHCFQGVSRTLSIRETADDQMMALVPYLTEIVAGGGEPLILPFWRRFLNEFNPEQNPHLRFLTTTNATILLPEVMEGLNRLPRIGIVVSIDGLGTNFEFIRLRADWAVFRQNMLELRDLARAKAAPFGLNVSVMKQNIHQLPDLVEFSIATESAISFQPVVVYPIDCSLRCFNEVPQSWRAIFQRSEKALLRLMNKLKVTQSYSTGMAGLWTLEAISNQAQACADLIPWEIFERPHTRVTLSIPSAQWPTVDFLRSYSIEQHWPRDIVCVVFAQEGDDEPHWYAPIEEDYSYAVSLPAGKFTAWLVQIDSVPLNASFARNAGNFWEVEIAIEQSTQSLLTA